MLENLGHSFKLLINGKKQIRKESDVSETKSYQKQNFESIEEEEEEVNEIRKKN